jgi:hypothetical protein
MIVKPYLIIGNGVDFPPEFSSFVGCVWCFSQVSPDMGVLTGSSALSA